MRQSLPVTDVVLANIDFPRLSQLGLTQLGFRGLSTKKLVVQLELHNFTLFLTFFTLDPEQFCPYNLISSNLIGLGASLTVLCVFFFKYS